VEEDIARKNAGLLPKKMFWNFGSRAFGSVMNFLDKEDIDGIIYLMSFGCGVDSFVCDLIERRVRKTARRAWIQGLRLLLTWSDGGIEMKITFPHMGNTYIAVKALLDDIGAEYVIPPLNSKRSLELGTKYAPEMACLPLKINIGNYIEAYEKCRFGYYCEMCREILNDNGYTMDVIVLEPPDVEIMKFIGKTESLQAVLLLWPKGWMNLKELRKGSTDRIYEGFRRKVIDVKGSQEILKTRNDNRLLYQF